MRMKIVFFGVLIFLVTLVACTAAEPAIEPITPTATEPVVVATLPPGEWDYLVLGDSLSLGYPELLKAAIEADFEGAVTVKITNRYLGGQTSSEMLERLQTRDVLREQIRNADLITFFVPVGVCKRALIIYDIGGDCGGDDNQDCLRECVATYKSDATAIFAELVSLRSPSEALIWAHDVYQMGTSQFLESGTLDVINGYWREMNAHVHATAENYGIPVARVYDAFMGADGLQPPEEHGLVQVDMLHTEPAGQRLIADLLLEFGYELAAP